MKCTPAHDPNDFALAKKYNLDMPICMNDDGTMNELCHKYQGMDRFECRKQLVADFEAAGIVDHIEKHLHQVGHSERSGAIVEPYLSKQWFVKMKPLAEAALANQKKDSKVNFVPERFEKTFTQWRKISKIGVFHVNYGGDIKYQHGIIKKQVKFMLEKLHQKIPKTGHKMKMS